MIIKIKISLLNLAVLITILGTFLPWFGNPIYSIITLLIIIIILFIFLFTSKFYYLGLTFLLIYAGAVIVLFIFVLITMIKDIHSETQLKIEFPNNLLLLFNLSLIIIFSKFINNFELLFENKIIISNLDRFEYNLNYIISDIKIFNEHLFVNYYIFLWILFYILLSILIIIIILSKQINEISSKKNYNFYLNDFNKKYKIK